MDRTDEAPKVRKGPRREDVSVRRMYFRKITEILRRSIKPIAKVIKWENQTPLTETKKRCRRDADQAVSSLPGGENRAEPETREGTRVEVNVMVDGIDDGRL